MVKYQNLISDYPERKAIANSALYYLFGFIALPYALSLFGVGFNVSLELRVWIEIGYHIVNALVAVVIFFEFIKDSFFTFQLFPKNSLIPAVKMAIIFVAYAIVLAFIGGLMANTALMESILPTSETELFAFPSVLLTRKPILSTFIFTVLSPITIGFLYYATLFSPICANRPAFGYIAIALYLLFPRLINAITFWDGLEQLTIYLASLPVYLLSCRLYQKTDCVWASIIAHAIANFIGCIMLILIT